MNKSYSVIQKSEGWREWEQKEYRRTKKIKKTHNTTREKRNSSSGIICQEDWHMNKHFGTSETCKRMMDINAHFLGLI
jgi:hypothetical protein